MSLQIGFSAEKLAKDYLISKGLKLLGQNFRTKNGEIDLIMQEGDTIVFIEVRARKNNDYGSPLETITLTKQRKIITAALFYLKKMEYYFKYQVRFDVASLEGQPYKINWIKNAFGSDF